MKTEFKNQMREIMNIAWQIFRITGETISACLKRAWTNFKLRNAMRTRIVRFSYIKKSTGELRVAYGTTDPHRYTYEAVGGRDTKPNDCTRYWDTEACGFRMFKIFNLVSAEV